MSLIPTGHAFAAPPYLDIAVANDNHSCGIRIDNSVECVTQASNRRQDVPDGIGLFSQISAGLDFTCGITLDARGTCWGDDDFGQLDVAEFDQPVVTLDSGYYHSCAIDATNQMKCWGTEWQRAI